MSRARCHLGPAGCGFRSEARYPDPMPLPTEPPAERHVSDAWLRELLAASDELWEAFRARTTNRYHLVIPCDVLAARPVLAGLRSRASTFLELGSATGAVTLLASRLGYEACGIEIEPWLLERSQELAERFAPEATLVEGTFVPEAFRDEVELLSAERLTPAEGACGYDALGLELDDFDLIYAYPWPGEEEWLLEMVRRHARPDALLLTYDASEGYRLFHARDGAPSET